MESTPKVGPFQLVRPLGEGGMATVWRARHIHYDQPVAVKVMHGERARKKRFVESFQREVQAVARLNHPGIVRVFDYGEIPPDTTAGPQHELPAGSPYMVMELAESTLLQIDVRQLSWAHVHTILVHILEALAHAHARQLIHRDLKPANVLFVAEQGGRLKLSDFGIAYALNTTRRLRASDDTVTGTPRYMAPEQVVGRLREQGPWTDLYALGCMAFWLVSGKHMFSAESTTELLKAHVKSPRPQLVPSIEVPEGFDGWWHQMVARHPDQRFRRAADASAALARITGDAPPGATQLTARAPGGDPVEVTVTQTLEATRSLQPDSRGGDGSDNPSSPASLNRMGAVPDLPSSWRDARPDTASTTRLGIGLGLFELREVPLVGRQRHRDALWQHLSDALHTRRPHAVVLEGPTGIGKTRLVRWLARRAHEVGAVDVLAARHSPIDGPADGLAGMFARYLRCSELSRDDIQQRLEHRYSFGDQLDGDELHQCKAVADLLAPVADPDYDRQGRAMRFLGPEQRYVTWRRLLEQLATDRPLLMVLDDVHWGADALQFAQFLLDEAPHTPLPLLVVMAVRPDLAADRPMTSEVLSLLRERPCVHTEPVGPLPEADHRKLVENLLKLEPRLAARVAERTSGNPLFAIQLVGDWIERGLLEPGAQGFELAADELPGLPSDIQAVLRNRLEQITGTSLDDTDAPGLLGLQLGAALGAEVGDREWHHLCEASGIEPPTELLHRLAEHSLVEVHETHWSFAHGALRETLRDIAADQGRLQQLHRRCVEMLQQRYDTSRPSMAPRLARHLLAAGDNERALTPLLEAIRYFNHTGEIDRSDRFIQLHRRACDELGLPENDRRRITADISVVDTCMAAGRVERAVQILDECEPICRRRGWERLLGRVLRFRSQLARRQARPDEAVELARTALTLFWKHDDPRGRLHCLMSLGTTFLRAGEYQKVLPVADQAESHAQSVDDTFLLAEALNLRGLAQTELGDYERARQQYQRVLQLAESNGALRVAANCHNNLGDLYRKSGRLNRAANHYREAIDTRRRLGIDGFGEVYIDRFNLGLTHLQQRDFSAALPQLTASLEGAERAEDRFVVGLASAGLAAAKAGNGCNWHEFDEHLEKARSLIETGFAAPEMARALDIAGEQAGEHGRIKRARRVWGLAAAQWRKVGDDDRADQIASRRDTLSGSTDR